MGQRRAAQILSQSRKVVGRQGTEERLEDDLQFPETGAEVIVKRVDYFPGLIRGKGISGKLFDRLVEFPADALDRAGKDFHFVEEARAGSEKDDMEEVVPRGGIPGRASAEVTCLERLDRRGAGVLAPIVGDHAASADENIRESGEQIRGHYDLFARAHDFATGAERERVAERDAHHSMRAFPLLDHGFEELAFFTGKRGKPILSHPPARGAGAAAGEKGHLASERKRDYSTAWQARAFLTLPEAPRYTAARLAGKDFPIGI